MISLAHVEIKQRDVPQLGTEDRSYPKKPSEAEEEFFVDTETGAWHSKLHVLMTRRRLHGSVWVLRCSPGNDGQLFYDGFDGDGHSPTDVDQAEPLLEGSIKWDGCCNVHLGSHEGDTYSHFCGEEDAASVGQAVTILYEIGKSLEGWLE